MHEPTPETPDDVDRGLAYLRDQLLTPKNPLWGASFVQDFENQLAGSVQREGMGVERALALFADAVLPSCRPLDSPRMLAFVPTAPTIEARLFDGILGACSIFGSHWESGAGAIAAENEALDWLASLAGLPDGAGGCFVSGGSASNLSALVAARYAWRLQHGREHKHRLKVALTAESHVSLAACAHVMDVDLVSVPSHDDGTMDVDYLREILEADQRSPSIIAVVATAGTTAVGAIDDLPRIAELCQSHGAWLHVDAAYGGAALCATEVPPKMRGIAHCDSLTVDPHKWFFAPYDCAALLYREPKVAAAAHSQQANYLDSVDRSHWNPADFAFHLSRRARGLPFWFSLVANGTEAYRRAVDRVRETALWFANEVVNTDGLCLYGHPELSIVLFQKEGWADEDYLTWSRNLKEEGTALINPIIRNGSMFLRICLVNPLTTRPILTEIISALR